MSQAEEMIRQEMIDAIVQDLETWNPDTILEFAQEMYRDELNVASDVIVKRQYRSMRSK